jgi:hypothetical protein
VGQQFVVVYHRMMAGQCSLYNVKILYNNVKYKI